MTHAVLTGATGCGLVSRCRICVNEHIPRDEGPSAQQDHASQALHEDERTLSKLPHENQAFGDFCEVWRTGQRCTTTTINWVAAFNVLDVAHTGPIPCRSLRPDALMHPSSSS
jgi:hypothetical protein